MVLKHVGEGGYYRAICQSNTNMILNYISYEINYYYNIKYTKLVEGILLTVKYKWCHLQMSFEPEEYGVNISSLPENVKAVNTEPLKMC